MKSMWTTIKPSSGNKTHCATKAKASVSFCRPMVLKCCGAKSIPTAIIIKT